MSLETQTFLFETIKLLIIIAESGTSVPKLADKFCVETTQVKQNLKK